VLAGPLAEIRERLARIENSAAGFYELAGRRASLGEARLTAIKDILERDSKVAAGCVERTPALLRSLNLLVEQSNRIENKLEGVSRTSGGPHIQFDALRPGLAPGFTYHCERGATRSRNLDCT